VADVAGAQEIDERHLVDDAGPRRVDEDGAGLELLQPRPVEELARAVVEGEVQADDVRAREKLIDGTIGTGASLRPSG
jgi:hypothetical protein